MDFIQNKYQNTLTPIYLNTTAYFCLIVRLNVVGGLSRKVIPVTRDFTCQELLLPSMFLRLMKFEKTTNFHRPFTKFWDPWSSVAVGVSYKFNVKSCYFFVIFGVLQFTIVIDWQCQVNRQSLNHLLTSCVTYTLMCLSVCSTNWKLLISFRTFTFSSCCAWAWSNTGNFNIS